MLPLLWTLSCYSCCSLCFELSLLLRPSTPAGALHPGGPPADGRSQHPNTAVSPHARTCTHSHTVSLCLSLMLPSRRACLACPFDAYHSSISRGPPTNAICCPTCPNAICSPLLVWLPVPDRLTAEERRRNVPGDMLVFEYVSGTHEASHCDSTLPKHFASVAQAHSSCRHVPPPEPLPDGEPGFVPALAKGTTTGKRNPPGFPTLKTMAVRTRCMLPTAVGGGGQWASGCLTCSGGVRWPVVNEGVPSPLSRVQAASSPGSTRPLLSSARARTHTHTHTHTHTVVPDLFAHVCHWVLPSLNHRVCVQSCVLQASLSLAPHPRRTRWCWRCLMYVTLCLVTPARRCCGACWPAVCMSSGRTSKRQRCVCASQCACALQVI
jgi:hypothetical protein